MESPPRKELVQDLDASTIPIANKNNLSTIDTGFPTIIPQSLQKKTLPAGGKIGNYEILQEIARGGMGVVYKAKQTSLNRVVALKMILSGSHASDEDIQRFTLEAKAAANLDHPNIVQVYDTGCQDGTHYFTMAFVEGDSLAGLIRKKKFVFSYKEIASMVGHLADAVQYAHDQKVIHRDLKPENVLVDNNGRVRITDFGLARRLEVDDHRLTASGSVLGTPSYMSPEQAMGKSGGSAIDIYALGGILYFLLARKPPFEGTSLMEILNRVVSEKPDSPSKLNPGVPVGLEVICLKCLEKDPVRRFSSAGQLAHALKEWSTKQATPEPQDTEELSVRIRSLQGEAASPSAETVREDQPISPRTVRWAPWKWLAGAVCLSGLLGSIWILSKQGASPEIVGNKSGNGDIRPVNEPIVKVEPASQPDWHKFAVRKEFDLTETIENSVIGENGLHTMIEGRPIRFDVKVKEDAHLGIWYIDPTGKVTQLFPNKYEKETFIKAGVNRSIPAEGAVYEISPFVSNGKDYIWIVASTNKWNEIEGKEDGPFKTFHTKKEQEDFEELKRGFELKLKTKLAEKIIPCQVNPAKQ